MSALSPEVIQEKERIVESGIDIHEKGTNGKTPLHDAAGNGKENMVRALIELGANIDVVDKYENTPLHRAAYRGKENTVRALVELGANIEVKDMSGKTPLHIAASMGKENTVRALVELGANIDVVDKYENTPLHITTYSGDENIVRTLIELGANIEVKANHGYTPLHIAAYSGEENMVRTLIELGANIDMVDKYGNTPLHRAAYSGKENTVRALVELGANIDVVDKYENTPLHRAAHSGKENTVRTLIELGANIEVKDNNGYTPLHKAASNGKENTVRALIELGAEITDKILDTWTEEVKQILVNQPSYTRRKLGKCTKDLASSETQRTSLQQTIDSVQEELRVCNTTSTQVPELLSKIQDLQGRLSSSETQRTSLQQTIDSVQEELRACNTTSTQVPELLSKIQDLQDRLSSAVSENTSTNTPSHGLETVFLHPKVLDVEGFDTIYQMDTTVKDFLGESPGNFVIFEGDNPHLIMSDSVRKYAEDGMVLGCFRVGYTGDTNVADELFNGNRLGTIYGYVPLGDLLGAMSMVEQGRKIFKLGESTRTVPSVIGRNFYEAGGGMVSANHCQGGASGPVRSIMVVDLKYDANVPESVNDLTFLTNAVNVVTNRTTPGTSPIVHQIVSQASDLGISTGDSLRFIVRWSGGMTVSNDMDDKIEKLLAVFQPRINSMTIDHGHSSFGKSTISFIRDVVGLKHFSLVRGGGPRNGYGIRSVIASLMQHKDTLESIDVDEIDSKIPSLKEFTSLDNFEASFSDEKFLGDILSHPSCSTVKLTSRNSFSNAPVVTTDSGVENLNIEFPEYTGSLSFLDKMAKLKKVSINAPRATRDYNLGPNVSVSVANRPLFTFGRVFDQLDQPQPQS